MLIFMLDTRILLCMVVIEHGRFASTFAFFTISKYKSDVIINLIFLEIDHELSRISS
jgi:hypothetical protein